MANINNGLELWEQIALDLNEIITSTGLKIDINNRTIWDKWLHQLTNDQWEDMLSSFATVYAEDNSVAEYYNKSAIERARVVLLKGDPSKRILDQKINKKTAWAAMMSLRETWNNIREIHCPNEDSKSNKVKKSRKTEVEETAEYTRVTIWHDLFEVK
jgi:hypothetical protein